MQHLPQSQPLPCCRLLNGLASVQDLPIPAVLAACALPDPGPSATIAAATAASRCVALHLSTGAVALLRLLGEGPAARLHGVQEAAKLLALDSGVDADDGRRVTAVCVAEDLCGWLGRQLAVGGVPRACEEGLVVLCRYVRLLAGWRRCIAGCVLLRVVLLRVVLLRAWKTRNAEQGSKAGNVRKF